jgi:hypothetical protein
MEKENLLLPSLVSLAELLVADAFSTAVSTVSANLFLTVAMGPKRLSTSSAILSGWGRDSSSLR